VESLELTKDTSIDQEIEKEESLEIIIYYGQIYLRYTELTNRDIREEDIQNEIKNELKN